MGLTFFGLTPEHRITLFQQIHEIVFFGKGGYDWDTVYSMPIWLRNFTFNRIKQFYEDNNSTNTVEQSISAMKSVGADKKQNIPTYVTKASKK